jgi:transforming growth factor-beta-induced protein
MMRRFTRISAVIVALSIAVAACGDDSASTTTTTTTSVPPTTTTTTMAALGTIPEVAAEAGTFTTLLAAVDAAGLSDTLAGPGPFTVFAPTDEAFAALPEGTVESLLADIPTLTDILLYHVVDGAVGSDVVVGLNSATTLEGKDITIAVVDGSVILNGTVKVIATDIEASNGVIHVIDAVLLPPSA